MLGNLLRILPRNWLSHTVGKLMALKLPPPLSTWSIRIFGEIYKINFAEAEKPIGSYESIGDFFTRRLKAGVRPLAESPIVHPADSLIAQIGLINDGYCVQAKGKKYAVAELLGDHEMAEKFRGGIFITYYLCPTDYHRVHCPLEGKIRRSIHIPGTLWPVNEWSINAIENLYPKNERLVVELESRLGPAAIVFVGATNVGRITTAFDPSISTNSAEKKSVVVKDYSPAIAVGKGDELGVFHMGSTVVALYPATTARQRDDWQIFLQQKVKMGEALL
jgi:phosphatidylserine decarboxylase